MRTTTILLAATGFVFLAGASTPGLAQQAPERPAPAAAPAQPKLPQYLRLQLGTTPTINWFYPCSRLGLEYSPMLTRHLGVAGRLVGVAGSPTRSSALYGPWIDQVPNQDYRAGFAEVEALLYPIGVAHRFRFALGLGGFAGYYKQNALSSVTVVNGQVRDYSLLTLRGGEAGYLGSLNLELALGKQRAWAVGLKLTRQKGSGGITNLPGQSLTLARQL